MSNESIPLAPGRLLRFIESADHYVEFHGWIHTLPAYDLGRICITSLFKSRARSRTLQVGVHDVDTAFFICIRGEEKGIAAEGCWARP